MKLRNGEQIVRLAPIDGKYFHAHIIDNVLAFSSYRYKHVDTYLHSIFKPCLVTACFYKVYILSRTMSHFKIVYITIVNFNKRRCIIDIDKEFYPTSTKAEIIIASYPDETSTSSWARAHQSSNVATNVEVNLDRVEVQPYQALLLKVTP